MQTGISYDKCLSFINCQIKPTGARARTRATAFRAVTLSRESGSGAHEIAAQLAEKLQKGTGTDQRPWTVFDKELITRVLEDHNLPARMAEFIPEDRMTELQDAVEELFGLRPPSWTIIRHTSETMMRLAELGNVILIGRGGNVVLRERHDVLHVRLVGSENVRAERLARARNLTLAQARTALRREDRGRARYLRKYFDEDVANPLLYHLTLNTDHVSLDRAAHLLAEIVRDGLGC